MARITQRFGIKSLERMRYAPRAYRTLFEYVLNNGVYQEVSGKLTKEIINASLFQPNPLDRLVTCPIRKMNIGFAIAEWASFMTGYTGVDLFEMFISGYSRYSSSGITIDGAYGTRVNETNQLNLAIEKLRTNSDTRQAVISIYNQDDLSGGGGLNTPCTLTMQFLVRSNRLHMIVNMRSNDVSWGLSYDAFVFTMVQEYIARQLELPLGWYFHNAASLHVYERDFDLYAGKPPQPRWPFLMDEMPKLESRDLVALLDQILSSRYSDSEFYRNFNLIDPYIQNLALTCRAVALAKQDRSSAIVAYSQVTNQTLRRMIRMRLDV